jgi:hypothetical protein
MSKKPSALDLFISNIKAKDKAERSPSETLKAIVESYTGSEEFDEYMLVNSWRIPQYIKASEGVKTRYRGSAAGKCAQQQAFNVLLHEMPEAAIPDHSNDVLVGMEDIVRPARQMRALHNGTFGHARWHLVFDGLHERGEVETLCKEVRNISYTSDLSGSLDRMIAFKFEGERFTAVIDFKTIKSAYWMPLREPQADHARQHHAYRILGFEADAWMMLYENKDTHELKLYNREYDDEITKELLTNYALMNKWVDEIESNEPLTVTLPLETTWCGFCKFRVPCKVLHPAEVVF